MELDLKSPNDNSFLRKYSFNLKSDRIDGLILQVHHSYSDSVGDAKKYRFIHSCFNDWGTHLAVADHKGHVFVVDLKNERYWQLPQFGLPTILSFPALKKHELLIGLDNTTVLLIHVETGEILSVLDGHTVPATEVSYSDDGCYYLTSSTAEAVVWESTTHIQIHRLTLKQEVCLKKALFMPVTNHILACFQDDTMCIWKFGGFECIKQIVPETWKTHHLKAVALTKNGRAMVIAGHAPNIVIFCLDTWVVKKVVGFPDHIPGVKQMEFISQVFDGGANKILVMLTTSLEIYFFDIETSVFIMGLKQLVGLAAKFSLSSNGKYLAILSTTGEVNIYLVEKIFLNKKYLSDSGGWTLNQSFSNRNSSSHSKRTQKSYESLSSIQKQVKELLDVKKLIPILKQFGEYPETYRVLIWKSILQLPENQESFVSLTLKKCHPSFNKLELKYPLANKSLCNSLKKLLSNLSHWCPLFGEVDFLPEFVFPFVKLFHTSPLTCFEVVATIIVNWCQNWFEFYPFPPINMLSVLESILGFHDPELLEFYLKNNITTSTSVCPLFHTSFSEVLSKTEWLKLWDHILSNEPSFFFMAIIAYNVVCKSTIKNLHDADEVEKFFHTQNPVDMKKLISKTYFYLRETPDEIHTRQFFGPFRPLGSGGSYVIFMAYPKLIIDSSVEKLQSIRKEEENILDEQLKTLSIKRELEGKLKKDSKVEDQERMYEELEEKIRKTVEEEEDRILTERQKLQNLRQELKLKELEILESTRDKALKEKLRRKEMELERLLKDIAKRKAREKIEVDVIEKEIRNYYSDLLLQKCHLELELGLQEGEGAGDGTAKLEAQRQKLKDDLTELKSSWDSPSHKKRIGIYNKIATVKQLMRNIEIEMAKEAAEKNAQKDSQNNKEFVEQLKSKMKSLEDEVEELLMMNLNKLKSKKEEIGNLDSQNHEEFTKRVGEKNGHECSDEETHTHEKQTKASSTGNLTTLRNVKCFTKKISPNVRTNIRKITTIRTRVSKSKISDDEKYKKPAKAKNSDTVQQKSSTKQKPPNVCRSPHKSKFTSHNVDEGLVQDFCKTEEPHEEPSDCESGNRQVDQPFGDSPRERKPQETSEARKKGNLSKHIIKKNVSIMSSDSEEDIFKTALNTRKQLIEEAKRTQNFP